MKKISLALLFACALFGADLFSVIGMPNKTTWLEKVSDEEYEKALKELEN